MTQAQGSTKLGCFKKVTESTAQCLKITQNVALMNFWSVNVARFARNFE